MSADKGEFLIEMSNVNLWARALMETGQRLKLSTHEMLMALRFTTDLIEDQTGVRISHTEQVKVEAES